MAQWRSEIHGGPDPEELWVTDPGSKAYDEWLARVMDEPWFRALEGMVAWTDIWVGTEEELIEEMRMRAGKAAGNSPDFPASFGRLKLYVDLALDGFFDRNLRVVDHRELDEEELDAYWAPGWGPEAPVLLFRGDAAWRPCYWRTLLRLLRHWHPLPAAVMRLTASREFARYLEPGQPRSRWYNTKDLAKALVKHYPTLVNTPRVLLDLARPEWATMLDPSFWSDREMYLLEPVGLEGHRVFGGQMRRWAPVLKEEARIKVSWERRTSCPVPSPMFRHEPRTYWTIEAPRWEMRDDLFGGSWW